MGETKKTGWKTIELFHDGDKYKDDVIVAVNGKMYQIQRGVPVEVPPEVYEVLQNSKKQDAQAYSFMEKLEADYANKAGALG